MKRVILLISAIFLTSINSISQEHVAINTESSTVKWIGSKLTESHNGDIKIKSGKLILENGRIIGGDVVIDMTTINTTDMSEKYNQKLNSHLNNEDFFYVEKFPISELKIISLENSGRSKYMIEADLTIKDITNRITFEANINVKGKSYLATANLKIDRTKWDIKYKSGNFFTDLGDKAILDDIEFDIFLLSVK